MCFLRTEHGRKIVLITQIAFVLLIAFVANPLLDQLFSFFSVSEHPMQAGSTVQSLKNFLLCVLCVCVVGGGGGGGRGPPAPLYPPLTHIINRSPPCPPPVSATDTHYKPFVSLHVSCALNSFNKQGGL